MKNFDRPLTHAGTLSPVGAANWIPLPASESAEVDTDSYLDSGIQARWT